MSEGGKERSREGAKEGGGVLWHVYSYTHTYITEAHNWVDIFQKSTHTERHTNLAAATTRCDAA
jgi:hypothetical protein